MKRRLSKWVLRKIDDQHLLKESTVLGFALSLSFKCTVVANFCCVIGHLLLAGFNCLPYPLWQALIIGCFMSTVIAFPITWLVGYLVGDAIRALTISRARFEWLSTVDGLSGLKNRRAFFARFEQTRADAVFVLMDIDRFKAINDTYGHIVGDDVIRSIGRALTSALSGHDIEIGRVGGEEFSLLIGRRAGRCPSEFVEMARAAIADLKISPIPYPVTLSAGVADITPDRETSEVYRAADRALYVAKAAGRDLVVHENDVDTLLAAAKVKQPVRISAFA